MCFILEFEFVYEYSKSGLLTHFHALELYLKTTLLITHNADSANVFSSTFNGSMCSANISTMNDKLNTMFYYSVNIAFNGGQP